jgi:hypothetical protein
LDTLFIKAHQIRKDLLESGTDISTEIIKSRLFNVEGKKQPLVLYQKNCRGYDGS